MSLSELTSLKDLDLRKTQITDVSALSGLTSLDELYLDEMPALTSVSLSELTSLEGLYLRDTPALTSVSLSELTNVSSLYLGDNPPQLTSVSLMDAEGSPMKGVEVSLLFYGNELNEDLHARTDANGKISIPAEKLPPDNYRIYADAQGGNLFSQQFTTTFTFAGASVQQANRADVNGDGIVNIQDLVLVSSNFGETGTHPADVNGDGVVNVQDLVLVSNAFD